jgi:hypothetical protein
MAGKGLERMIHALSSLCYRRPEVRQLTNVDVDEIVLAVNVRIEKLRLVNLTEELEDCSAAAFQLVNRC